MHYYSFRLSGNREGSKKLKGCKNQWHGSKPCHGVLISIQLGRASRINDCYSFMIRRQIHGYEIEISSIKMKEPTLPALSK